MTEAKETYSVKKILLFAFGGGMLVFGLIALVLPFLPGSLMLFCGLACCTKSSRSFRRWHPVKRTIFYIKKYYPGVCL